MVEVGTGLGASPSAMNMMLPGHNQIGESSSIAPNKKVRKRDTTGTSVPSAPKNNVHVQNLFLKNIAPMIPLSRRCTRVPRT